jgi:hypothetical protein
MWFRELLSRRRRPHQPVSSISTAPPPASLQPSRALDIEPTASTDPEHDSTLAVPPESESMHNNELALHTEHDIWKVILDYVEDRGPCQLVCQAWRKHLRPHLMRSLLVNMKPHQSSYPYITYEGQQMEARIFRELGSIVQRVRVNGQFAGSDPACLLNLQNTLPGCGSITDLTLEDVEVFPQWGGLSTLVYKSNNLGRLCLFKCYFPKDPEYDHFLEEEEETTTLTQPALKQLVLLVEPKLNHVTMRWLQRTPTMQTLRSLSVAMFENAMISSLVEWINHRLERLEHLELRCIDLVVGSWSPHISNHPSREFSDGNFYWC